MTARNPRDSSQPRVYERYEYRSSVYELILLIVTFCTLLFRLQATSSNQYDINLTEIPLFRLLLLLLLLLLCPPLPCLLLPCLLLPWLLRPWLLLPCVLLPCLLPLPYLLLLLLLRLPCLLRPLQAIRLIEGGETELDAGDKGGQTPIHIACYRVSETGLVCCCLVYIFAIRSAA